MKIAENIPPFNASYNFLDFTDITERNLLDWLDESFSEKQSPKKRKAQSPTKRQTKSPTKQKPPINKSIEELPEKPDIHLIFEEIVKRISQQNQAIDVLHEPANYFKHQLKPDFVFNEKNRPHRPFYCLFVAELQIKTIDLEHKGRLFQYMDLILEANPCRKSILSFVTNLRTIAFAKSKRSELSDDLIEHYEFPAVAFWPSEHSSYNGVNLIKHMINNPDAFVGYKSDEVHFSIDQKMFYIHKY